MKFKYPVKIKQILHSQINKGNQVRELKYCYSKETYWNHIKMTTMQLNLVFGAVGFVGLRRNTYSKNISWHTNMKAKHESTKEVRVRTLLNERKKVYTCHFFKKLSDLITWPQDIHFSCFFSTWYIYTVAKFPLKCFNTKHLKIKAILVKHTKLVTFCPAKWQIMRLLKESNTYL